MVVELLSTYCFFSENRVPEPIPGKISPEKKVIQWHINKTGNYLHATLAEGVSLVSTRKFKVKSCVSIYSFKMIKVVKSGFARAFEFLKGIEKLEGRKGIEYLYILTRVFHDGLSSMKFGLPRPTSTLLTVLFPDNIDYL